MISRSSSNPIDTRVYRGGMARRGSSSRVAMSVTTSPRLYQGLHSFSCAGNSLWTRSLFHSTPIIPPYAFVNALRGGLPAQEFGHLLRGGAVPLHSQGKRLEPLRDEEGVKRAHQPAKRPHRLPHLPDKRLRTGDDPSHGAAMSSDVLGSAV